jgi:putative transposase
MIRAYKYRIYPNNKQQTLLAKHFGCARFIYNWGLATKTTAYQKTGKSPSCFSLMSKLPQLKKENEWLKEINSQSLQMSLRNLDNAFQRFFKKRGGYPKFKKKYAKQSCQFPQSSAVSFENNRLYVMKFREGIKCKFDRKFTGDIKTVTISCSKTGKYYASIIVDNGKKLPKKVKPKKAKSIGVDLGLNHFITLSSGEKIVNPRHFRKLEHILKIRQKQLSRKKLGSSNRNKARKKVALIHERICNQRYDFLHKLSKRLIDENQAVCLEDLNVSGMLKNHKLAKNISDASWSTFCSYLSYKADWYGKTILTIGRFDPSSKLCSQCGCINTDLKLSDRTWVCDCGAKHDRDILAANNILNFAFCTPGQGGS